MRFENTAIHKVFRYFQNFCENKISRPNHQKVVFRGRLKSQRAQELLRTNAASICQRISSGEEGAVDDYLAFLKLGGSQSPDELLSVAKVDPLDSQTYQLTLDFFGNLVDEYEQICNR